METKKALRKDLERKRGFFLQIGVVVTLSIALIAFEWTTEDVKINFIPFAMDGIDAVELPPVIFNKPEEMPEKAKPPRLVDELIITDNPDLVDEDYWYADPEDYFPTFADIKIEEEEREVDIVVVYAEVMPEFPGGYNALLSYLARELKYHRIAQDIGIFGKLSV